MNRARFPSFARLKSRAEFLRVQNGGKKRHVRFFLVFVLRRVPPPGFRLSEAQEEQDGLPSRLGITVTRKVGNAVERNRIKRLLRDVYRREREGLPTGIDMVWVAKKQALGVTHAQVSADFRQFQRTLGPSATPSTSSNTPPAEKDSQAVPQEKQEKLP